MSHVSGGSAGSQSLVHQNLEPTRKTQYGTLPIEATHNLSLTRIFRAIPQANLHGFVDAVLRVSNHSDGLVRNTLRASNYIDGQLSFDISLMTAVMTITKSPSSLIQLKYLLSESNSTFEALVEVVFHKALEEEQVDLVRFLINTSKVGPNDFIPMPDGFPMVPLEIAIEHGNFIMVDVLISLGANWNVPVSDRRKASMFASLAEHATRELLQNVLDSGLVDAFEAVPVLREYGHKEFARTTLEQGVKTHPALTGSRPMEPEEVTLALSALRGAIFDNNIEIANTILAACRYFDIALVDDPHSGLVYSAVETQSLEMTTLLLEHGAYVNVPGPENISPLALAILHSQQLMARLLLDWGAFPDRRLASDATEPPPLQMAVYKSDCEMALLLINRGADVDASPSLYNSTVLNSDVTSALFRMDGHTAMSLAAYCEGGKRLDMVQLLGEQGANINAISRDHKVAKHIRNYDYELFLLCLRLGASFAVDDAFHVAAKQGEIQYLSSALGNGADVNALDSEFRTPITLAISSDFLDEDPRLRFQTVSYLMSKGATLQDLNKNPLEFSAALCKREPRLADLLFRHGARIDALEHLSDAFDREDHEEVGRILRTASAMDPLPMAMQKPCFGHYLLWFSLDDADCNMAMKILEGGVTVTPPCAVTAVMRACYIGNEELLDKLLSLGAPVDLQRDVKAECWGEIFYDEEIDGFSPLQLAARHGRFNMARTLLHAKASVDTTGEQHCYSEPPVISDVHQDVCKEEGKTTCASTLSYAVESGLEMFKLIQQAGASIHEPAHDQGGRTALQKAAQVGDVAIVEYLLREKADVDAAPAKDRGVTALQAAAINSHFDIARRLLEAGADPNAPGAEEDGRTALEGAAENGRIDMVQLLLDNGANIESPGFGEEQYGSSVALAEREGFYAAARLLKHHRKSSRR